MPPTPLEGHDLPRLSGSLSGCGPVWQRFLWGEGGGGVLAIVPY